jgi:hypothetical protein
MMEKSLHQLGLILVQNIQNAGFLQSQKNDVAAGYDNLIDLYTMMFHVTSPV